MYIIVFAASSGGEAHHAAEVCIAWLPGTYVADLDVFDCFVTQKNPAMYIKVIYCVSSY